MSTLNARVGGARAVLAAFALLWLHATAYEELFPDHFTNDFVVKIRGDDNIADLVAISHGFRNMAKLESLGDGMFHFVHEEVTHRSKRSAGDLLERLLHDPNVEFVEQQRVLVRDKKAALDHERNMVYDKQSELHRPLVDQELILERYFGSALKRGNERRCQGSEYERKPADPEEPVFNDEYECLQWYLHNDGQTKGKKGYDINVRDAWRKYTGRGVVVTVLDDGLDHEHPDIKDNYDPRASYDLNDLEDKDHDPQPPTVSSSTAHGTRCAGEIAGVANNGVCGVGVAYEANIGGVRLLDGHVTDKLEAQALSFRRDYIDIYSSSWGPRDDGKTMEGPNTLTSQALRLGAEKGRNGKGNVFVWATGNGGANDDCSADGYVSSIYTLSVGCINDKGESTYFSESCTPLLAVIFTGGSHAPPHADGYDHPDISIITADVGYNSDGSPKCDLDFEGTSSAAPLAAGCFALVLQANPELTWRDIQHLVVETARIPNPEEGGWTLNGAGYHVNHMFGFGSIDCSAMTSIAVMWQTVNEQLHCDIPASHHNHDLLVDGGGRGEQQLRVEEGECDITRLEHVEVHVRYNTTYRGDMSFHIVSPSGTDSEILSPRPNDDHSGEFEWTFMTTHCWNEQPHGDWVLWLQEQGPHDRARTNKFYILEWSLTLYGTNGADPNEQMVRANKGRSTQELTSSEASELPQENLGAVMQQEEQDYSALRSALEGGRKFSRDAVVALARELLDDAAYQQFQRYVHDHDNEVSAPAAVEEAAGDEAVRGWDARPQERRQQLQQRVEEAELSKQQLHDTIDILDRMIKELRHR